MSRGSGESESERRVYLAELRTLLAEKRTLFSELQLSTLLITLPLTIHTGLMVLATRHAILERLHVMIPFWSLLAAMLLLGVALVVHSVRGIRKVNVELRRLARSGASAGGHLGN